MNEISSLPNLKLGHCKLLKDLPPEAVRAMGDACIWHEYEAEEIVLDAKDKLAGVYFIAEGRIRLFHRLSEDRVVNMAEFKDGDSFGELSAIDGGGRAADAMAVTRSVLAVCPREIFLALVEKHPQLAMILLKRLAHIIRNSDRKIADLAGRTATQRVYAELLRISSPDAGATHTHVISPAPLHRDIASWAATTTDVVARALGNLMRANLLNRRGMDLVLSDPERVKVMMNTENGN